MSRRTGQNKRKGKKTLLTRQLDETQFPTNIKTGDALSVFKQMRPMTLCSACSSRVSNIAVPFRFVPKHACNRHNSGIASTRIIIE
jgi:hypothetical protein